MTHSTKEPTIAMKLQFYLRFQTRYGQSIWLSGDADELGNDDLASAIPMEYLNEEFWSCSLDIKKKELQKTISYRYILKNEDGELLAEWGNDRVIEFPGKSVHEIQLVDTWNHAGEYENAFYADAFKNVLLKPNYSKGKLVADKTYTHEFCVKAPLVEKHELVCISGTGDRLSNWSEKEPVVMGRK
jgi:4-alpha-glucanotransferase